MALCASHLGRPRVLCARGHTAHHRLAGTDEDPDLPNYRAYPIKKRSLYRKWTRDLTGQTGFKLLAALATGAGSQMSKETVGSSNLLAKQILVHLVFASILIALGVGWTWFVWMGTFLTSYMWVVRLRQVGEHAVVPDLYDSDVPPNQLTSSQLTAQQLTAHSSQLNSQHPSAQSIFSACLAPSSDLASFGILLPLDGVGE